MKKFITVICVLFVVLVVCYNAYQSENKKIDKNKMAVLAFVPITGPGASYGKEIQNTINLYKEKHPDSKLNIEIVDSQSSGMQTTLAYQQKTLSHKPDIVIGILSGVIGPLLPITKKDNIPLIALHSNNDFQGFDNAQKITDERYDRALPIIDYMKKHFQKVAIICSRDEFGLKTKSLFLSNYQDNDHTVLIAEEYDLHDQNTRNIVDKVVARNPEAIFVVGYGPAELSILRNLLTGKYAGPVLSSIGLASLDEVQGLHLDQLYFSGMESDLKTSDNPEVTSFKNEYFQKYGNYPWISAVYTYDALSTLEHFVENATPINRQAYTNLKEWDGVSGKITFNPDGSTSYKFYVIDTLSQQVRQ